MFLTDLAFSRYALREGETAKRVRGGWEITTNLQGPRLENGGFYSSDKDKTDPIKINPPVVEKKPGQRIVYVSPYLESHSIQTKGDKKVCSKCKHAKTYGGTVPIHPGCRCKQI